MIWIRLLSYKTIVRSILIPLSFTAVFLPQISYGAHGQEITISLDSAFYIPLTGGGNQVNVLAKYTVNDPSLINQMINSVMKVYTTNGTLIKTSSSAEGFNANQTGIQRHATTISDSALQSLVAVVQFTDLAKTIPLSNPLKVDLILNQTGVL
jgi:hypothetical protein